ncbi:hypothetical protein E4K67_11730 [Desulfosporosinus fructosivorans]|uniref:Uncharacterized protein n=1 Tax=Desulfosporosinus fructosivorans TaxID=2018669 RepID=A0A4Z0R845_9FIRM|nr:hypothetical protein [Desulfosporosinus fructosivorans]TGE38585.1 hypothetical protein E4K67_11730 [Desulfosporosinus fructosivorans]
MSKLKIMYDVINTMKEKEVVSGTFKALGMKDQVEIGHFVNEFEKNLTSGETKVKINAEFECQGKKLKHDSQSEFTMKSCSSHNHHGFLKHMNHHNPHEHLGGQTQSDNNCCGIKGKLTKLGFMLNVLNQIKVDEKEDKSVILSLNLTEMPEELAKLFQGKMSEKAMPENHPHHAFMKEFCTLSDHKVGLSLWINKDREVEKIVVTVDGNQIDALKESHVISLKAELILN